MSAYYDEFVLIEKEDLVIENNNTDKLTIKHEVNGENDVYVNSRSENGSGDGEDYLLVKKTPFAEPFWGVVVNRI